MKAREEEEEEEDADYAPAFNKEEVAHSPEVHNDEPFDDTNDFLEEEGECMYIYTLSLALETWMQKPDGRGE